MQTLVSEIDIIRPYKEDREMRFLQLENELKVLLIKDPDAATAASCMYVRSGSLNDSPKF